MLKLIGTLCLGAFSLSAATYYVSPSGNDSYIINTIITPWKTIDRLDRVTFRTGDQVLFARGGTWRESIYPRGSSLTFGAYGIGARPIVTGADLITTGWASVRTGVYSVALSVEPKQVWFSEVLGQKVSSAASVTATNQWFYSPGILTVYSATSPSTAKIEVAQRDAVVAMDSFSNEKFQSLRITKSNALNVFIGASMSGTQSFTDVVWDGSPAEGIMALGGKLTIASSIGQLNAYGVAMYGGTGLTMTNSILSGNYNIALILANTTAASTISQSTITGNSTRNVASQTIANWTSYPLTASKSILLPNPYQPALWNFDGLTDDGTNVYKSPMFTARATPLIVIPYIDDYNNLAVAQTIANLAASYGFHLSYALNTRLVKTADWTQIAAMRTAGHDIVAHTRTHSDLASLNVVTIGYTGASTATVTINVAANKFQTFLNGATTPDIDQPLSNFYAVADLCSYLSARPGYSCSAPATELSFNPVNFADISGVSITSAYVVQADPTRFYTYEIQGAKSDIQANIPGYTAQTFATPFSSFTGDVLNRIRAAGFQLNRNGLSDSTDTSSFAMSHLDMYNLAAQSFPVSFVATDPTKSVASLVEGLGAGGGVLAVYSHGYDEFTLAQWTTFFANLKAMGGTCMTATEAATYIKARGMQVQDGTGRFWNASIPFTPNYTPSSSAPTQGARLTN